MEHADFTKFEQEFADIEMPQLPNDRTVEIIQQSTDPIQGAKEAQHYVRELPHDAKRFILTQAVYELNTKYATSGHMNQPTRVKIIDAFTGAATEHLPQHEQIMHHLTRGASVQAVGLLTPFELHEYIQHGKPETVPIISVRLSACRFEDPSGEQGIVRFKIDSYMTIPVTCIDDYLIKEKDNGTGSV